jgi:hypothetical protein
MEISTSTFDDTLYPPLVEFRGPSEYLEDLVSQFDASQPGYLHINLFNQLIFDTRVLVLFISPIQSHRKLNAPRRAEVALIHTSLPSYLFKFLIDYRVR